MPVLHLKNKITRSLVNTVNQALSVGGIPDYISLDPKEGYQLLKEYQELESVRDFFTFKQDDEKIEADEPHIRFLLGQKDDEARKKILNRWYQKYYTVYFLPAEPKKLSGAQTLTKSDKDDLIIPLKVVKPKPKVLNEEKDSSSK